MIQNRSPYKFYLRSTRYKKTFWKGHYSKSSFRKVQAISLDTSGCDLVTERIDIGTNLLYDVLEPWSGSQPKPINPIRECWVAFSEKIRTLNWLRWFLSTPVGDALQITYARVTINIAKNLNVRGEKMLRAENKVKRPLLNNNLLSISQWLLMSKKPNESFDFIRFSLPKKIRFVALRSTI